MINEEFENDKIWIVSFNLTTLKTMVKFNSSPNLKIFNFPNNKFESISNFQMKSSFLNIILNNRENPHSKLGENIKY